MSQFVNYEVWNHLKKIHYACAGHEILSQKGKRLLARAEKTHSDIHTRPRLVFHFFVEQTPKSRFVQHYCVTEL